MPMVRRLKIDLEKRNAYIGILLVFLGIAAPLIINVNNFEILQHIEDSILDSDSGKLLLAAFKLVILNSLRALPHYLGAFIIAESVIVSLDESIIYWLRGAAALIIIPFVYKIIFLIYNISYDFGAPAFIAVFSIILVEYLNFSNISLLKKSLIVILLLFSVQWLDIIPALSAYGFGRGDISTEIKIVAGFIGGTQVLTFASITFFIVFMSIAFLISKLLSDEEKLIKTTEKNKEIEMGLAEARLKAVEARTTQEMQSLVHDLKTPLTSVQALATVSQMITEDEKIKLYMEKTVDSVDSINKMISQILYENSKDNIPTEELFEYVLSQLASHNNKDHINYTNRCQGHFIYVNKIRLSRAIINIVNNALDAIDSSGTVNIIVEKRNKHIVIIIEDDGVGIDEVSIRKIWEAGFSTKNSTGLGLSFVEGVIHNHGGSLELFSTKDKGTKLIITLQEAG